MIAEQIARFPMLLDELLVQHSLHQVIDFHQYPQALQQFLLRIPEDDEEQLLEGLRQFKQIQLLRIAAADILGALPVMKISDHLTYLAQAMIEQVVRLAWRQLTQRFGTPDYLEEGEQGFAVIGYGKLGGIELGYNSDLDLVFLHHAPNDSQTIGGQKQISSQQFYLKLAQKIISLFNLNTHSGVLYEIDLRLRPSGEAGLLVSTFKAFEDYQQNEAWTWESQALVRARAVYGEQKLVKQFEQIRQKVLAKPRASGQLRQEICQMRQKMYQHLTQPSEHQFHLKTDKGGITDIEFIAQYLVLAYSQDYPQMAVWSDNVRIFESAITCQILTKPQGESLINSYTTLRNAIHHLNLQGKEAKVSSNQFQTERQQVEALWLQLLENGH